jgi:hypothetical protein
MSVNTGAAAQRQDPASSDSGRDDPKSHTDDIEHLQRIDIPKPLKAVREHCKWCTNGSAVDVHLCASRSCTLWPYRLGRKPTPEVIAEVGARCIYPLEDGLTSAAFFDNRGSVLKAIAGRCLDCSGNSKSGRNACPFVICELYPFRLGKNPNRAMSPGQRKIAAARLKANVERRRRDRE